MFSFREDKKIIDGNILWAWFIQKHYEKTLQFEIKLKLWEKVNIEKIFQLLLRPSIALVMNRFVTCKLV